MWKKCARLLCAALMSGGVGCGVGDGAALMSVSTQDPAVDPELPGSTAAASLTTGLPCETSTLLATQCLGCHGAGAAMPLTSLEQLRAPAASAPGLSMAEAALARMRDGARPMPPGAAPSVAAADLAAFSAWVSAGMPEGTCGTPAQPVPEVLGCATGARWTGGNEGSSAMQPGMACQACHVTKGPATQFAGTVYGAPSQENLCNGARGVTVTLTDARGVVFTVISNGAGNFHAEPLEGFTPPYRAQVSLGDRTRSMATPQTSGDCNACHTERGSPGRILAP